MNEAHDQLPLAHMMTINRPSFWVYFIVCVVLFVCSVYLTRGPVTGWKLPSAITLSVFIVLTIELLSQRIKDLKIASWLVNACYLLETACVIAFVFILFGK